MTWLFILVFLSLAVVIAQVGELCRRFQLPVIVTCTTIGALLLFCGSVIPGSVGHYEPMSVGLVNCVINIVVSLGLFGFFKAVPRVPSTKFDLSRPFSMEPVPLGLMIVAIAAATALFPLIACFFAVPVQLLTPEASLNWDVVSYHLPGLVEFMQTKTLWSLEGPFQAYSQGYELVGGMSLLFFRSFWGFLAANAISLLWLLATLVYLTRQLSIALKLPHSKFGLLTATLLVLAALVFMYMEFVSPGKNDVFEAAAGLAGFAYLLDACGAQSDRKRHVLLLALAAMSNGLALATKPPWLVYLPVSALLAAYPFAKSKDKVLAALGTACGAVAIGGFFLLRNLVVFHSLSSELLLSETIRYSMIHCWRDVRLYNPFSRAAFYACAGLTGLAMLMAWFRKKTGENAGLILLIGLFELSGVLGFTVMPTGVSNERELTWQDRKVMIAYLIAAAIVSLVIAAKAEKWKTLTIPRWVPVGAMLALVAGGPFLSQWWNQHWPMGLPGYERIKNLEATNVYRWVQEQPDNQRIYSSGLRPWGLYGRDLNNRVFYDLHSHILEQHGPERVLAVLQQFHPQLILISVDPHDYTGAAKKPAVVDWLRSQPYFTEIYNDQAVSGFTVKDGWQQLLNQYKVVPVSMKS